MYLAFSSYLGIQIIFCPDKCYKKVIIFLVEGSPVVIGVFLFICFQ